MHRDDSTLGKAYTALQSLTETKPLAGEVLLARCKRCSTLNNNVRLDGQSTTIECRCCGEWVTLDVRYQSEPTR